MQFLALLGGAAAVGIMALRQAVSSASMAVLPATQTVMFPVRGGGDEGELSVWSDDWEITSKHGRVRFTVEREGNEGAGLIVALATSWRSNSAGIAAVLGDGVPMSTTDPMQSHRAVTRAYFAEMPFVSQPALQSSARLNFRPQAGQTYEIRWSPGYVGFYNTSSGVEYFNYIAEARAPAIRYVAFGVSGAEQFLTNCAVAPKCTYVSGVEVQNY
jgi:hypothetical protein